MDSCGNSQKKKACDPVLFDRWITILHKYPLMLFLHSTILRSLQTKRQNGKITMYTREDHIHDVHVYARTLNIH